MKGVVKVITVKKTRIEYTKGDTFSLKISASTSFGEGSTLRFIVARDENANNLIDNTVSLSSDGCFYIDLKKSERDKLEIDNYKYKCVLIGADGVTITQKSGDFIVKWGA